MRIRFLLLLMIFSFANAWAQTVLFIENMGSPTGTVSISTNTFQNNSTLTYTNGGQTPADIRSTASSSNYTGSSAGGNVYFTAMPGDYGFSIEGINASNYSTLSLQFGYKKESATAHASLSVDYWNGTSWITLANSAATLFNESAGASALWYLSKTLSLPTGAQINGLKIRFVKSGSVSIRIDDVKLTGTEQTTPAVINATVTNVSNNSATFGGSVTGTGGTAIISTGTLFSVTSTNGNPILGGTGVTVVNTQNPNSDVGTFTNDTGVVFSPNVQYSYNAFATRTGGVTGYGTVGTFYTLAGIPTAPVLTSATSNTITIAVGSDANSSITTYAIFETITGTYVQSNGTLGNTAFFQTASEWGSKVVTGLSPVTSYTFQTIAKNGAGVSTAPGASASATTAVPPSTLSDIIFNSGSTTSDNTNINYIYYQSANITSTVNSVGVMGFYLRDGGAGLNDADNLATELTAISFNVTNGSSIRSARLFVSNSPKGVSVPVINGTLTFTGLTGIVATDNSQLAVNLRVTFNSAVTDNEQMKFTIASATASSLGSQFALANGGGASSSIAGDINRIEVTASKLVFTQQPPSSLSEGTVMSPSPVVAARDAFENIDLDFTGVVSLSSTGSLVGSLTATAISGTAVCNNINHTGSGSGLVLTASYPGLSDAVSSQFIVVPLNIVPTFNPISAICTGAVLSPLPTTSTNGITGSWSPSLNNTATTTYIFTPNAGQGAVSTSLTITVNPATVPTFNNVPPTERGGSISPLPSTSLEGVPGSWTPSAINNMATTTYTFTPSVSCANATTLTIIITDPDTTGGGDPNEGGTSSTPSYHDTQGKLEISASGQAVYTLPVALPPSISSVGPTINLVYSGGQSGGIAGQGWNINSISNITRIATRSDIDGFKDGVDFDDNDKLALDGQRLLVKAGSTYWGDGSLYETEVQSNTKIQLIGTGTNTYFIVTTPDGSRSWYGNYGGMNATDLSSYYIVRFEDAEGNFILYNYSKPFNKSLCVDTIQFSANTNGNVTPLNYVKFYYTNAVRTESGYFKGQLLEKVELLNKIRVYTDGNLFKEYRLTHTADTQLGYQRVTKIREFNGAGEAANPVVFEYNNTPDVVNEVTKLYTDTYDLTNTPQLTGDFDGDGKMDIVASNKLYIKTFLGTQTPPITLPTMSGRKFAATTLKNNKLNQSQTIIDATMNVDSMVFKYFGYNYGTNTVVQENIKTIAMDNSASCSNACEGSSYSDANLCNNSKKTAVNYIEGDFNGDGITEVIVARYDETYEYDVDPTLCIGDTEFGGDPICLCSLKHHIISTIPSEVLLVNLDGSASTTIGSAGVAILSGLGITRSSAEKTMVGDYNSDGKSDLLVIKGDKSYKVYTFNQLNTAPWVTVEVLGQGILDSYKSDKPVLLGDYNGDGKPDIMIPVTDGDCVPKAGYSFVNTQGVTITVPPVVCPNIDVWDIFYSNPNPAGGAFYTKVPTVVTDYNKKIGDDNKAYFALDVNKDGKSDIVKASVGLYFTGSFWDPTDIDSRWSVSSYVNNLGNTTSGAPSFIHTYTSPSGHNNDDNSMPIPLVADISYRGLSSDFLMIRYHGGNSFAKKITYIDFNKDVNVENGLKKVTQSNGAIVDEILYAPMQSSDTNNGLGSASDFYSSNDSVNYPTLEVKQIPSNKLVSRVINTTLGVAKYQDFRYNGFIVQLDGVGSIGFKKIARTSWYVPSDKKTWAVTEIDPLQRGSTKYTYVLQPSTGNFSFPSNLSTGLLNKTENNFTSSAPGVFPYSILVQNQKTTDYVTGIINETVYNTYDTTYNLPLIVTKNNYTGTTLQGSTTTVTDYDAPSFGTGSGYFIGRPNKITTTATVYGNGGYSNTKKSFQTFSYVNGNISQINRNVYQPDGTTPDPITMVEKMTYYPNGLLKDKEVSAIGTTAGINDVSARKVAYTYDPTNRFVVTVTDPELLVTTNMSFHPLYGSVLVAKDPFNQTITNVYDNWGKQISVTDNTLNLKTNYTYSRVDNTYTTTVTKSTAGGVSDGSGSVIEQDVLAREIRKGSKNLNGTWNYVATEYDAYGRKYRASEPYVGPGSPSQWTVYAYDDYSRPTRTTSFTGKIVNTTYSGLTVTVADSVMSKSKTIDANGQVTSTTDNPGGTINYKFDADGNLLESNYGGIVTTMTYDNWGRKTQLTDSSSGTYTYTYNAYGELTSETAPKGITTYTYDGLSGRILTKSVQGLAPADATDIVSTYNYNSTTKLLDTMTVTNPNDGGSTFAYTYDAQRRLYKTEETQTLLPSGTAIFTKQFTFDAFSRVDTETNTATAFGKTSAKTIKHGYSGNNGAAYQIKDNATLTNLWQANTVDARGNIRTAVLGNGISIVNTFDQYGYASRFQHKLGTADIMTLDTSFDPVLGNLTSRYNSMFDVSESFTYDSLDRLTAWDGLSTNLLTLPFNTTTEGFTFSGTSNQGSISNSSGKLKVTIKDASVFTAKDPLITAVPGNKYRIRGDISNKTVYNATIAKLVVVETDINDALNYIETPILTLANGSFDLNYVVSDNFESAKLSLKFIIEEGPYCGGCPNYWLDDNPDGGTPITAAATFYLDNLKIDLIAVNRQDYDDRGRITNNNVGEYQYDATHPYQNSTIRMTPEALNYYTGRPVQDVAYNAFKAPVTISEQGVDLISFGYNAFEQRSVMYYGNTSIDKLSKPYRKYYSADGSMEIKATFAPGNATTPTAVEFLTYIGGDAYSALAVVKSDGTAQNYFYLHRDYQGSILAVTNAAGAVVEKRLFDPWGEVLKVQDGAGNTLPQLTFFDRGYTGHEHLQSVGLINMNARLYDAKLHRFLEADNFVQDPYNTQNYNRYGYCVNNPLKYTDVTGNIFNIATLAGCIPVIGSIFASLLMHQPIDWGRVAVDAVVTGISAAVTFGIGSATASIANFYTKAAVSALAHGAFQGGLSAATGGKFWAGFAAGALSSIAASFWEGGASSETHFEANSNLTEGHFVTTTTIHEGIGAGTGAIGTLAFSAVMGGAGSALAGGNFWQGATTGLIVSGFNHAMHQMTQEDPLKRHANEVKHTLKEWEAKHQDMSYDEIKNEVNSHKGQEWRYIKAPDGNIMDMRHVIVVGYGLGDFGGDLVEVGQLLTGNWDSAFDIQDFYSNKIGDVFHQLRDLGSWSSKSWSYDFKRFIDTQYSALFNNYKPVKL